MIDEMVGNLDITLACKNELYLFIFHLDIRQCGLGFLIPSFQTNIYAMKLMPEKVVASQIVHVPNIMKADDA